MLFDSICSFLSTMKPFLCLIPLFGLCRFSALKPLWEHMGKHSRLKNLIFEKTLSLHLSKCLREV